MIAKLLLLWLMGVVTLGVEGNVFDDAQLLLTEFETTVDQVITNTDQTINSVWNETISTAYAVRDLAVRVLFLTQQDWYQELDALAKLVQDADACLEQANNTIQLLPTSYIDEIEGCIEVQVKEMEPVFAEASTILGNARQSVQDYRTRIEYCRTANDEFCLILVVVQIEVHNALLPTIVENDVQETLAQLDNAASYYQICTTSPTTSYNIEGRNVVEAAKQCLSQIV